jgi:O-6-methylguanine DNA methyltransferase
MSARLEIETPAGIFLASFTAAGLAELRFPSGRRAGGGAKSAVVLPEWNEWTHDAVLAVLAGKPPEKVPPLDLSRGSRFQQSVWRALQQIPRGATDSYSGIARRLKKPNAARAVGNACGANPIPLLIPCHRVLASGGRLGGFSAGLDWKRRLLAIEGMAFQ